MRRLFFLLFLLFSTFSHAANFSLSVDSTLLAELKSNKSASVFVAPYGGSCGDPLAFTISSGGEAYDELFFSGTFTALPWQGVCGFVRGHCGYNSVSISNSSGEIASSTSGDCLALDEYSASFQDLLVATGASSNQTVSASAKEAGGPFPSLLKISADSFSAKVSRKTAVSFQGNTTFQGQTATRRYLLPFEENGTLYASLEPGATVSFQSLGVPIPFNYNPSTGAFSSAVFPGNYFLEYSYSSAEKFIFFAQQLPATAGIPVSWNYSALATAQAASGTCTFSGLPISRYLPSLSDGAGNEVSFVQQQDRLSFQCSPSNYFLLFQTPAPALAASDWVQNPGRVSFDTIQFLHSNQSVHNPSDADYENVSIPFACIAGAKCDFPVFSSDLPAGLWRNFSVNASGSWVLKNETRGLSDGYALFLSFENTLFADLAGIYVEQQVPPSLSFSLYSLVGAQGGQSLAPPTGFGYYQDGATAFFSIPLFPRKSRQALLLYAMRKSEGQYCAVGEECISNNCTTGACSPGTEYFSQPNLSSNSTQIIYVSVYNASLGYFPDYNQSLQGALQGYNNQQQNNSQTLSCTTLSDGTQICSGQYGFNDPRWRSFKFANGAPNNVSVTGPGNESATISISKGSFQFFFGRTGNWTIETGKSNFTVQVVKKPDGTHDYKIIPNAPLPATGLSLSFLPYSPFALFAAILLVLAGVFFSRRLSKPVFSKSVEGGQVTLSFDSKNSNLINLEITDIVPPGHTAANFSEAPTSQKETLLGTSLHWSKKEIAPGKEWRVSYSLRPHGGKQKRATLRARGEKGEVAFSTK